jgi:hypothetical protein
LKLKFIHLLFFVNLSVIESSIIFLYWPAIELSILYFCLLIFSLHTSKTSLMRLSNAFKICFTVYRVYHSAVTAVMLFPKGNCAFFVIPFIPKFQVFLVNKSVFVFMYDLTI